MASFNIEVHEVSYEYEDVEFCNRVEVLEELVNVDHFDKKIKNERVIIFVKTDSNCRALYDGLNSLHRAFLYTEGTAKNVAIAEDDLRKFHEGEILIGIWNPDVIGKAPIELPDAIHYVFLDFPKKLSKFGKIVEMLEEKSKNGGFEITLDVIASKQDKKMCLQALEMEMSTRDMPVPRWMLEEEVEPQATTESSSTSLTTPTSSEQNLEPAEGSSQPAPRPVDHSRSSSSSSSSLKRKATEHSEFDYRNMKPNAEGFYIIPLRSQGVEWDAKTKKYRELSESDSDEDDVGEEFDERDYNYEEQFDS